MDHNCKKSNDTQPSGFKLQDDGMVRCSACGQRPTVSYTKSTTVSIKNSDTTYNKNNRRNR